MSKAVTLPQALTDALQPIGEALAAGRAVKGDLSAVLAMLGALDPGQLVRAEQEIARTAALHRWRREPSMVERLFVARLIDADQLPKIAGLEYLFIFHRDGRLREAALRKIAGPIGNAFLFAAVAWRLNDWAEPVRAAAAHCAAMTFPQTRPDVIADAAVALLTRRTTWGRWGSERAVLNAAFDRSDVAAHLARRLATRPTGPMCSLLRQSLRSSAMDAELDRLAVEAVQPAVRAAATQVLIEGEARWPDGWRWRWVDKSMGLRRRETAFATRPLSVSVDRAAVIRRGLRDRAAGVGFVALAGLLQHDAAMPDAEPLADRALADPSPANAARARFLLNRMRTENGEKVASGRLRPISSM